MEWLNGIDWQTVGAMVSGGLAIIGTSLFWLRKNLANLKKLKDDGEVTSTSIKYSKANIQSNKELLVEIAMLKKEVYKLGVIVNTMNKSLAKEEKQNEI